MKISKCDLLIRAGFLLGFLLVILGARYPLCEIEGMGEFELVTFSGWGASMIVYLAWAGLVGCLAVPAGIVRFIAGCLVGAVVMLGVTLGKDSLDLARMDAGMSSSLELVQVAGGGRLIATGVILLALAAIVTAIPFKKKSPTAQERKGT